MGGGKDSCKPDTVIEVVAGSIRFLLLNDFSPYWEEINGALRQARLNLIGYRPKDKADFLDYLVAQEPAVILIHAGGSEAAPVYHFEQVKAWLMEQQLTVPIWMIVDPEDEATAVSAMYAGLTDYFFTDRLSRIGPMTARLVGQYNPLLEPVDLNQVMEGVCSEYQPLFDKKAVEMAFLPAVDLPLVPGEPQFLAQAFLSILEKVVETVPPRTKADVRPYLDAVKAEVCVEIKLSGDGLQTEQQIKAITISETTLSTANKIIESQNGRVQVDGGEDFGIRIRVTFPAILEKQVKGSPKLLIVENSPLMRSILQEALEQEGFTVRTAEHGAAALNTMADFRPDLIISDIIMPVMDGFTFFEAVRENPDWQEIPFIFVTGQSDQKERLNPQSFRGATYLIKPVIMEELLVAIHSRLQS